MPTDCPQRERAGWTGDIQVFVPTAASNMMVVPFLSRWLDNRRQDQQPDGQVSIIVPMPPSQEEMFATAGPPPEDRSVRPSPCPGRRRLGGCGADRAVGAVSAHYGDRRVLEQNYRAMADWVAFQSRSAAAKLPTRLRDIELPAEQRQRQDLLWNGEPNFGDWLTPSTLLSDQGLHVAIKIAPRLTSELVGAMFGGRAAADQ